MTRKPLQPLQVLEFDDEVSFMDEYCNYTFDDVIRMVEELRTKYPKATCFSVHLEDEPYCVLKSLRFRVRHKRKESVHEQKERLKKEEDDARDQKWREEWDRKEFERLKKKYMKNDD